MRSKRALILVAGFALAASASAQFPTFGPELQVNTTTTDIQRSPSITTLGTTGNFVVVWSSNLQDGANYGIFGRRLDSTGAPLGAEFQVNAFTSGYQLLGKAASDAAGNFVVAWIDYQNSTASYEIRARRFNSTGVPQGGDIVVNTYTTGVQSRPAVAMSSTGNFVVVWESGPDFGSGQVGQDGSDFGVFGQRFNAVGAPQGSEFQVNQFTTSYQARPRIAMEGAGDFLVVWNSDQDAQIGAIMARRYDAAGAPVGSEFQVNTTESGAQYLPDVALDSTGKAIVAWQSFLQDGSGPSVYAQRLDASGNKLGPEFNVNTFTTGFQGRPRVAVAPDNGFAIVWHSAGQDDPSAASKFGVFGQYFDPTGRRAGAELPINAFTTDNQQSPHVAAGTNGMFVTVWESNLQDGSSYGIETRAAGFPAGRPAEVDARASGGPSNVNGVLEVGERVTVDTAYENPSAAALALSGTASNFQGPPGGTYTLNDTSADYGSIAAGATADCFTATANCYELTVGGTRPQQHWDTSFSETLSFNAFVKPWIIHVGGSFPDVPQNAFYPFIENLFHNGVTGGCAGGNYCPGNNVTRAQMAVFLLKSRFGSAYVPNPATGLVFTDVPASNPFAPWIESLAALNITGGCGGGLYCPDASVTRQQMAVFLLKTKNGSTYAPPTGSGIFGDVACPGVFCDFIEDLYNQGITGGCQASPLLYCPANPVLRQQMAVFLVKTFGLQLYSN